MYISHDHNATVSGPSTEKNPISWLSAGETTFKTRPRFCGAGLGEPQVPDEALVSCVPL